MSLHAAEHEGEGQQLECAARDPTRCQGDGLLGKAAQVASSVREAEAVADDSADARADARQLPRTETVPYPDDHQYADESDAETRDDHGARRLLSQDEECDNHRGQRGARVDQTR